MPDLSDSNQYRITVQNRILLVIKEKLEKDEMDADKAQELSAYVLSRIKKNDSKVTIYNAVKKFDLKKFPELLDITILSIKEEIEDRLKIVAEKLGKFLSQRRYNDAIELLKNLKL